MTKKTSTYPSLIVLFNSKVKAAGVAIYQNRDTVTITSRIDLRVGNLRGVDIGLTAFGNLCAV